MDPSRIARRRGLRRLLLALIGLLYVASIPWYRDAGADPEIVLGLPDWVATALLCYVGVALLNSVAWLLTDVEDEEPARDPAPADRTHGSGRETRA
jgi:hypothetical protein